MLHGERVERPERHSPQGECGLKSGSSQLLAVPGTSLPTRGVRVEILAVPVITGAALSLPTRGVRVEIEYSGHVVLIWRASLPTRGVRVEIRHRPRGLARPSVTPHKGSAG